MSEQKLNRSLSFIQVMALASGAVIGGWLAEAPYWFSLTGAGAAWIFPLMAILLVPVGLAFGELSAVLPYSSSVDVWTCNAFGHKAGWATQWLMFLIQVVEPPMMAFIFVTAINHFIPIPQNMQMPVAVGIVCVWYVFSNFNVSLTGILAQVFFFAMVGISILVAVAFLTNANWSVSHITDNGGWFPMGPRGFFVALAVFSLKFIGFEMTPTLVEEMDFPLKNIWKVVLSALFIPAVLYCLVVNALGGMLPWKELAAMSMPEPELVDKFGMLKLVGIAAIVSGILHALTTLMGFWVSSARVLYGAAQLNQLPKVFMKLNKHGQPAFSNFVVLLFSIFFCLFTGDNWVQYVYAVSCIAAGLVYMIVCVDAIVLRKKHPEWKRPYTAPGGTLTFSLGIVISAWIVIGSCLEMSFEGYISLVVYLAIGGLLFLGMENLRRKNPGKFDPITLTPDDIDKVR